MDWIDWLGYGPPIRILEAEHYYLEDEKTGRVRSFKCRYLVYNDLRRGVHVYFKDPFCNEEFSVTREQRDGCIRRVQCARALGSEPIALPEPAAAAR